MDSECIGLVGFKWNRGRGDAKMEGGRHLNHGFIKMQMAYLAQMPPSNPKTTFHLLHIPCESVSMFYVHFVLRKPMDSHVQNISVFLSPHLFCRWFPGPLSHSPPPSSQVIEACRVSDHHKKREEADRRISVAAEGVLSLFFLLAMQ